MSGEDMPRTIDVVAKITNECFEEESVAFQKEVRVAYEKEYQLSLKAWEVSLADSPTRTPEEIAATLENAAFYLQPFVDAIQQRFRIYATVLLAGPIGCPCRDDEGCHANWPTFDWLSFQDVEASMTAFAWECFSEAECKAQAVGTPEAEARPLAMSSAAPQAVPLAAPQAVPSAAPSVAAVGGTGSAVGSWVQTSDMWMEDRKGEQGEQRKPTPNENEECGQSPVEIYDQRWQRDDRTK
ncbi:hypothetical protein DFH08DRAFT_979605 [Mycena albidolilacea]|uniref:Uncharacterized protein n=1 Tax=Mycena albidolilacea TaxID=1033008 RepID=A0AAD6YX59_9AGAR|nr:hypothetical protein DFH08DRAFT_979605 [Mycena albidolilacea]